MSAKVSGLVLERFPLADHTPFVVALVLADAADHDGSNVRLSVGRISVLSRTSERTVQYQLRSFEKIGFLHVARPGGGRNRPTEYRIDITWLESQSSVLEKKDASLAPIAETAGMVQLRCSPSAETAQKGRNATCTQPITHDPKTTDTPSSVVGEQLPYGLVLEPSVLPHRALLQRQLLDLPAEIAQAIADEVAGSVEAIARGQRPPIVNMARWIATLRDRAIKGAFEPSLGLAVKARRMSQRRLQVHTSVMDAALKLPSVSRDDAFAAIKAIMQNTRTSNKC
jgi:hypothetical protein